MSGVVYMPTNIVGEGIASQAGGGGGGVGPPGFDPYFYTVTSLLHFEGVDGTTVFTDVKGNAWTPTGDAQIDTAVFKWGLASGIFDGTNDRIQATLPALGVGDYTVECWVRTNSIAAGYKVIWYHSTSGYLLYLKGATFLYYNLGDHCVSAPISVGQWYHVALVRASGVMTVYVDGIGSAPFPDTGNLIQTVCTIGGNLGGTEVLNGWIDEFRISKMARYTSNFAPPTAPFPDS